MALDPSLMKQILQVAGLSSSNTEAKDILSKAMVKFGPHMSAHQKKQVDVAKAGSVGIVYKTKSRSTGTHTSVYLTAEFEGPEEAKEGKYTVVCEDHGTCVLCYTLEVAKATATYPKEFCGDCRELGD